MAKKGFIAEFKEFISRGNVMDLAVGVIIGGAFQSIVSSLVSDIFMPIITVFTGGIKFTEWKVVLSEAEEASSINYGNFIAAVINFLIMALIIFCFVKAMNILAEKVIKKPEEEKVPTTKVCPYCLSEIPIHAVKCAHCTSDLTVENMAENQA